MLRKLQLIFTLAMAYVVFVSSTGFAQSSIPSDSIAEQIKPVIEEAMTAGNIPSLAITLADKDGVVWQGAFGYANVLKRVPADTDTVYLIGSTFKAQSTMALLQLVDDGEIELDKPAVQYTDGLAIQGEDVDNPVLVWHLLTHCSGLPGDFGGHLVWGFTAPDEMDEYLKRKLKVDRLPELEFEYSNTAFQLVAKIIETVDGKPYRSFIKQRLWDRLEMNDTSFILQPDQYERLAIPYLFNENNLQQVPATRMKADVWAAGLVY